MDERTINELKKMIADLKHHDVINILFENSEGDINFLNSIVLVKTRLKKYEANRAIGLLSDEQKKIQFNEISYALTELCDGFIQLEKFRKPNIRNKTPEIIDNSLDFPTISKLKEEKSQETKTAMKKIRSLISEIIPNFENDFSENFHNKLIEELRDENIFKLSTVRALIIGSSGVGKTTIINHILGEPIFPTSNELSCTKSLACCEHQNGLIFYDSPGLDDDFKTENITRSTLLLPQLVYNQIHTIRLFDLTLKNLEGPEKFKKVPYEEFANEINREYYEKNKEKIVVKDCSLEHFQNWVKGKFDFILYVMDADEGISNKYDVPLIKKIYSDLDKSCKIFKLINIKSDKKKTNYESDIEKIKGSYPRVNQAIDRLKDIPNGNKWYIIDAFFGLGFETLIEGFIKSLPAIVLMQIEGSIKKEYSNLVQMRLEQVFYDYVAKISAHLGVYPVNHEIKGESLLEFGIKSMIWVAEFMFGKGKNIKSVEAITLDKFILDIKKAKTIEKYGYNTRKIKVKEFIRRQPKHSDSIFGKLNNYFFEDWEDVYDKVDKNKRERYYYNIYKIGGIETIELVMSIGKAMIDLYSVAQSESIEEIIKKKKIKIRNKRGIEKELLKIENGTGNQYEISQIIYNKIKQKKSAAKGA